MTAELQTMRIEESAKLPEVVLDSNGGTISFKGICIPEDAASFFGEIFGWIDVYLKNPLPETNINFEIEYMNTSSMKSVVFLLSKFEIIADTSVTVNWYYDEEDDDILELGEDLQYMSKLQFQYIII